MIISDDDIKKILSKKYKHFDSPLNKEELISLLNNIEKIGFVEKYRFHPFILFYKKRRTYKRSKNVLKIKEKVRPISLTSHRDAVIYRVYSEIISEKYENYLLNNDLTEIPTAYRKYKNMSNITSAKEAIDKICFYNNCWIIKGDFDSFFDNIRHRKLTDNLKSVLNVDELPQDWKSVLKSLTKYRFLDSKNLSHLINEGKMNRYKSRYVKDLKELGDLVHNKTLKLEGPNQVGIPQGTPLSAMLANIYMIEFDKKAKELIDEYEGFYRRYSDDFIIVVPKNKLTYEDIKNILDKVILMSHNIVRLTIKNEKTKIYKYEYLKDANISRFLNDGSQTKSWFDYLGFKFNGQIVKMRDKSLYKFHYKSKKMLKHIANEERYREYILSNFDEIQDKKSKYEKRKKYLKRMPKTKKNELNINLISYKINKINSLLSNIPQKKTGTFSYLTINNKRYSMVGYAKRAHEIFKCNDFGYESIIMKQIENQIDKNKKYMGKLRNRE